MEAFWGWPWWDAGTAVAAGIGSLICAVFVIMYHLRTGGAWRRSRAGRFMMQRKAMLSGFFALVLVNRAWPGWDGRAVAVFLLTLIYAAHTIVIYRLMLDETAPTRVGPLDEEPEGKATHDLRT